METGESLMWIPPQTTRPPFCKAAQRCGTRVPTGAKIIAASNGLGWDFVRSAGPNSAKRPGELLIFRFPGLVKA